MVAAEEVNRSFHFSQDSLTIHSVPIGFTARRLERIDASDSAETECRQWGSSVWITSQSLWIYTWSLKPHQILLYDPRHVSTAVVNTRLYDGGSCYLWPTADSCQCISDSSVCIWPPAVVIHVRVPLCYEDASTDFLSPASDLVNVAPASHGRVSQLTEERGRNRKGCKTFGDRGVGREEEREIYSEVGQRGTERNQEDRGKRKIGLFFF